MPELDLSAAVKIDALVLVVCALLIARRPGLRLSCPAVVYIAFHALVFTFRAIAINSGAPTFLSSMPGFDGVRPSEIARALVIADIALVSATLGWISTRFYDERRSPKRPQRVDLSPLPQYRPLQLKYIHMVAAVAMPLGLVALAEYGTVPASPAPTQSISAYFIAAESWPGLIFIALIYFHGFRPALTIPTVAYLAVIGLQGYDRFRLVIPVLLLCQIYLDRHGKRWPGKPMVALLVTLLLLFFPLKTIGRGVQQGEAVSTIGSQARSSIVDALAGRNDDQAILDEFALAVSGASDLHRVFWGVPYLNVLVLPVPRQFWPGKPGLADYLKEISPPGRPLAQVGGVTTLPGDLYINFRIPGLILLMFLLARLSSRAYSAAYRRPFLSVGRFGYLVVGSNFIQIFRDGLISLPVFFLVNMMPLAAILILHLRVRRIGVSLAVACSPLDRRPVYHHD